ncbi:MAG: hypothetical protein ACR2PH_02690, partial [Desulfobulbia bacterium]
MGQKLKQPEQPDVSARRHSFAILPKESERLVGMEFRCRLSGYQTGDIEAWEWAWNHFAKKLGAKIAKPVVTELSCRVRVVHGTAARPIKVYLMNCAGFCRDECMEIALIAASQNNHCPAMRACAFALLECNDLDDVISSTEQFATILSSSGLRLSADSVINANGVIDS